MIDVRFPTALQLMLNLAFAHAEGVAQLSSAQLASALGANPSLVRKLLSPLADAGLVRSSFGRDGGIRLGRPADAITLREIYSAVLGEGASGLRGRFPTGVCKLQHRTLFRRPGRQGG